MQPVKKRWLEPSPSTSGTSSSSSTSNSWELWMFDRKDFNIKIVPQNLEGTPGYTRVQEVSNATQLRNILETTHTITTLYEQEKHGYIFIRKTPTTELDKSKGGAAAAPDANYYRCLLMTDKVEKAPVTEMWTRLVVKMMLPDDHGVWASLLPYMQGAEVTRETGDKYTISIGAILDDSVKDKESEREVMSLMSELMQKLCQKTHVPFFASSWVNIQ